MNRERSTARRPRCRLRHPVLRRRGDEGQALVLVLIMGLVLVLVAPIIVSQVTSGSVSVGQQQNFEAALAAAQAGVQQYRNLLNTDSNYWEYSATSPPPSYVGADPALTGWEQVRTTAGKVDEWFHYIPDTSQLNAGNAGSPDAVVVTVTGRAGNSQSTYQYRTIQVALQSSGILTNSYFSQVEVEDPAQNTRQICEVADHTTCFFAPASPKVTFTYDDTLIASNPPTMVTVTETLWSALCNYDTYTPNWYIDTLDAYQDPYSRTKYNPSDQYYGPWRGNDPNYSNGSNSYGTFTVSGTSYEGAPDPNTPDTPGDICGSVFNFVSGETFQGNVYSNDQLWVCGSPTFSGTYTSGVPKKFTYAASPNWPTQVWSRGNPVSGTNGWIDNAAQDWDGSCPGVGGSSPSFEGSPGLQQGGNLSLPALNSAIRTAASAAQSGGGGCVYTGPTMVQFLPDGYFDVWSPLTPGSSAGSICGTFSAGSPYYKNAGPIGKNGLTIYVQNAPSNETYETPAQISAMVGAGALPNGATCANPWKPYVHDAEGTPPNVTPATDPSCTGIVNGTTTEGEGDAVVEGEVAGQVTVGAAANIVISRDITYACAPSISQQQAGTPVTGTTQSPTCQAPGQEDVLGLAANGDVVIGHPGVVLDQSQLPPTPLSRDDLVNTFPAQTEPYEWPAVTDVMDGNAQQTSSTGECVDDGQGATQDILNVVPDCEISNPVIDAAVVALNGSFADEDWDLGNTDLGGAYLQGADVSNYRGPFGYSSGCNQGDGYCKNFQYDARLGFLTPPNMVDVAGIIWNPVNFVNCGDVNDINNPATVCAGLSKLNG
jgi:hypothetical protein